MAIVKQLILASSSPSRKKLLNSTGLSFFCEAASLDEKTITHPNARQLAACRSTAKALDVASRWPGCLVIGGDQTLSLNGQLFTKATNAAQAELVLSKLAGKTHDLHSAFSLAYAPMSKAPPVLLREVVVDTAMPMRPLTSAEVKAYLLTNEWQGCVGCYQFEHRGLHLFDHQVMPDYSAVVGLPLLALLTELRSLGINGLLSSQGPWQLTRLASLPTET